MGRVNRPNWFPRKGYTKTRKPRCRDPQGYLRESLPQLNQHYHLCVISQVILHLLGYKFPSFLFCILLLLFLFPELPVSKYLHFPTLPNLYGQTQMAPPCSPGQLPSHLPSPPTHPNTLQKVIVSLCEAQERRIWWDRERWIGYGLQALSVDNQPC